MGLSRRQVIIALAALPLSGHVFAKDDVTRLTWDDLAPADGLLMDNSAGFNFASRGSLPTGFFQPFASYLTTDYNGSRVRLDGFMLPLEFDSSGVTSFLLVPYVGACIHVPPPPPNQLVFVRTDSPYESNDLFAAISVTGILNTESVSTDFADTGYTLQADMIDMYEDW